MVPSGASLKQQAQTVGVGDRLEFIGHVEDVPRLIGEATFLVHASDKEGCPNAVMEAMACGRAVVATNAGDGKTGFVVRRGDDEALIDRIATPMMGRNLCRRMGEAGQAKAEREFGLSRLVDGTLAAYRAAGWKEN
jgi:glycosyltransferase involved in cell wall biosynthesis